MRATCSTASPALDRVATDDFAAAARARTSDQRPASSMPNQATRPRRPLLFGARFDAGRLAGNGTQPRPERAARAAQLVEPARRIVGHARRQQLGLPGTGRSLVAFELREDAGECLGPADAARRGDVLPLEQETGEVAR